MGYSLYLASEPDFWYGPARLLDFGNTFDAYNQCQTGKQADSIGILLDWELVGQDLWESVRDWESQADFKNLNQPERVELASR